jgi:hypothetical protein
MCGTVCALILSLQRASIGSLQSLPSPPLAAALRWLASTGVDPYETLGTAGFWVSRNPGFGGSRFAKLVRTP